MALIEGMEFFDGDGGSTPLTGKGLRIYDGAHSGAYAALYSPANAGEVMNGHYKAVTALQPHCTIIALGTNDWLSMGRRGDTFEGDMRALVSNHVIATNAPTTVILVKPPRPVGDPVRPPEEWADMMKRLDKIASDTPQVVTLDMQTFWPVLEAGGATNAGLIVESATPVHPTDAGMVRWSDVLASALTDDVVSAARVPSAPTPKRAQTPPSGNYVQPVGKFNVSAGLTKDVMYLLAFQPIPGFVYNGAGIPVFAASTGGGVLRFGIYAMGAGNSVGRLLKDFGTVTSGTTGARTVSGTWTGTEDAVYLAVVAQTSVTNLTVAQANNNSPSLVQGLSLNSNGEPQGYFQVSGVTGALPEGVTPTYGAWPTPLPYLTGP